MIIFLVLAIAINVFIIVEAAMSGDKSASQSGWVSELIAKIFNITPDENYHHLIRKLVGHFGLYVVDGVLTTLAEYYVLRYREQYKERSFLVIFLSSGVVLASISEFIQLLAMNRGPAFTDILINFSGYFLGGGIVFLIAFLLGKKKDAWASCFLFW